VKIFYNRLNFKQTNLQQWLTSWLASSLPCPLCHGQLQFRLSKVINHPSGLCADCEASLPWYDDARCPQCALPNLRGDLCGVCLQHPPAFDQTLTVFRYAYPLDRLLHQFKYHQQLPWGALLADAWLSRMPVFPASQPPAVLVAMPMHLNRIKQRGFNHALELAKQLQKQWQVPLRVDGCERVIDTSAQAGMDMKTRTRNLRGAFATQHSWQGQHVMIVDDVMTTGASMHALAKVFKQAGAAQVTALVLARTLKQD